LVHRIFANLKVWALGVYHGLRRPHLQSYLDEFVFRFNRRRTRHAGFRSLLGIAAGYFPGRQIHPEQFSDPSCMALLRKRLLEFLRECALARRVATKSSTHSNAWFGQNFAHAGSPPQ
jgi:hypothetical protein